jgi:hypothetical protein
VFVRVQRRRGLGRLSVSPAQFQPISEGPLRLEADTGSPGIRELILLSLNLKGKIFVVKHLDVQMKQTRESFKRIPSNLPAEQALSMLLKGSPPLQASARLR